MSDDSCDALDQFVSYWVDAGKLEDWQSNVIISKFFVQYRARGRTKSILTNCHLYHSDHRIELIGNEWLNSHEYYTGFNPEYQRYSLRDGHVLRIDGCGSKLNGAYYLTIIPD